MAKIIWLDDEPADLQKAIVQLRKEGHEVGMVTSDKALVKLLEDGYSPDIVIQDLYRPGFENESSSFDWQALLGWELYEGVLKARYPQVGVIVCSMVAEDIAHRKKADDFNLTLLHKVGLEENIHKAVEDLLRRQSIVFSATDLSSSIVAVDFNKVSVGLLRHLARYPSDIHKISWSAFEKLVERLLSELGYEVFRTPLTRDGGVDLWAVSRSDLGDVMYAIDAKKYSPKRLVGPEPVRAIHGVADMAGSSVGMIVTTSYFSRDAISLAEQYRYKLSLQDFDRVSSWIEKVSKGEALHFNSPSTATYRMTKVPLPSRRR